MGKLDGKPKAIQALLDSINIFYVSPFAKEKDKYNICTRVGTHTHYS